MRLDRALKLCWGVNLDRSPPRKSQERIAADERSTCTSEMFSVNGHATQGDVMSCPVVGKWSVFMLSRLSPSIIFNLVHVLAQKKEWHSHGYNGRKQTWLPPLSHFVVRFPPSGETAKKNVKQVVNLSYAQSFFCRCREYGDGHYFPPAMNCPFKSFKPLFWFSHSQMIAITFQFRSQ